MGLSGLGYNGHVFWDTEIFMFPPMLMLQPDMARSMLEYRFERLDEARRNASSFGFEGAMYPWESASTGAEETRVRALTGAYEHHASADVAIAAWNYWLTTQDREWLETRGWPMLKATAEFWSSRAEKGDDGKYHIYNVICPDEYAVNKDDNAYTNGAAKRNLEYAIAAARELGLKSPQQWQEIADGMFFDKMQNGVTSEYVGYDGEPIKQADVNLLAYPLKLITDKDQVMRDLEYYSAKVPQKSTPAMTQSMFSVICSRLGDTDKAYEWFIDSYRPNQLPPFGVLAECKGGKNPYFATGAGGTLQAVIMGFGGLDFNPDGGIVQVKSHGPPKHWKKLTITGVGTEKKTFVVTR
jgi:trehalose/maltose hydrolase-like predicted phosphorylase